MTSSDNGHDQEKKIVGSTLVIGAGIAGMQAALDLAEVGIKVYLLDRSAAVGGTMAQLDKTFPTNDCAMCIMSPKLVEVGRHLNIELLTCAEVEAISGEPGDFTVTVRQHPRYVDLRNAPAAGTVLRPVRSAFQTTSTEACRTAKRSTSFTHRPYPTGLRSTRQASLLAGMLARSTRERRVTTL
jgi:heterodisulfide reductase subunit A-like polyferredoxin